MLPPKIALNLSLNVETNRYGREPITLRAYLKELLVTVWKKEEGFSGKRPFGYSGWQYELAGAMMKAGVEGIGSLDNAGDVETVDHKAFDALIYSCIDAL